MISKSLENATRLETFTVANNKATFSTDVTISGNLTVYGDLSTTGTQTFSNTVFATTSALSVVNVMGTGPALYIGANGTGDIASFYDIDQNIEVLHVGGANGIFPNVGVKTSTPNKTFTVNGEISASNDIWTGGKFRGDGSLLTGIVGGTANAFPLSGGTLTGTLVGQAATFTSVSAVALSGTFFGDGSKLTGIVGGTANALPLSGGNLTGALIGTTARFSSVSAVALSGTFFGNGSKLTGVVATDSSKLPLTGGTLTGALVGTSASFTSIAGYGAGLTGVVATDSTKLPLTGGTLTGPVHISSNIFTESLRALVESTSLSIDVSTASFFTLNLFSAPIITLSFINTPVSPRVCSFALQIIAAGTPRTIAWPTSVKWPGGIAPTLTITSGKTDTFSFLTHNGGSTWFGYLVSQNQ